VIETGIGNPLEAGTYYLGVIDPTHASSYTLQSRGIGLTNYTLRVKDLDFTGSVTNSALAVGQADYYRVVVPDGVPDWKLRLSAVSGKMYLKVQRDYLPNNGPTACSAYGRVQSGAGGQIMNKAGDQQWTLLPENGNSNVTAGTYYLMVASQGINPGTDCDGSAVSSYSLSSGIEPATVLPDNLDYSHDLVFTNVQAGGELKFYQFHVPSGLASLEVRLEGRVGNPIMYLNTGTNLIGTAQSALFYGGDRYGNYGGNTFNAANGGWVSGSLITIPNPASGSYSLMVDADPFNSPVADGTGGDYPDASYALRVRAVPPTSVAFDGGSSTIVSQPAGQWQFFQIDIPSDAFGWDLRLVGVTNGSPQLVVARDALPDELNTGAGWPHGCCYYYCGAPSPDIS